MHTERPRVVTKKFMNYLKFHRMNLGLTQKAVARKANISQGAYCDYEKGFRKPRPKIHKDLAAALQRPVEEFTSKLYGVNPADMVGSSK
jgi:transcriptional regulator with XRE-family HTH domain